MPNLTYGLLSGGLLLLGVLTTQADDAAVAIVKKAIKAHGGEVNLNKLKVRQEKSKGTLEVRDLAIATSTDSLIQVPGHRKDTSERDINNRKISTTFILNGTKAWQHANGSTREYTGEQQKLLTDRLQRDYVLTLTPLLEDGSLMLSPLGEVNVGDRPALGVKVAAKDRPDVDLFFDKESGLLVKSRMRAVRQMKESELEIVYSAHKVVEGLKWPMKSVESLDGKKTEETEITAINFLSKLDDSVFAKP